MLKANRVAGLLLAGFFAVAGGALAQTNSSDVNPAPGPQVTQPPQGGVNWKGVGIGAGTVASNVFYMPAKLVYGILGGIGGGAAYALTGGNKQVANTIWRSSLGGDYIVTPDMLTGKQRVHFNGPTATAPPNSTATSSNTVGDAAAPTSYAAASNPVPPPVTAPMHSMDVGAGPVTSRPPASSLKTAPMPDNSIE